jgi:hypothetical protein
VCVFAFPLAVFVFLFLCYTRTSSGFHFLNKN